MTKAHLRDDFLVLASQGLTASEISSALGVSYQTTRSWAIREGVPLARAPSGPRVSEGSKARAAKIAGMFRQGCTLQKIGDQFKLTRERVRQILAKQGIAATEGGASVKASIKQSSKAASLDARYIAKYGFPYAVVKEFRAQRLTHAFTQQRINAARRAIPWRLTFEQWITVWQASGKLHLRGLGVGKYVMSRICDDGAYELGNVHIQLTQENSREAVEKWRGKTKDNRGVFCLYPGRDKAWMAKVGKKSLGFFESEALAVAAREEYLRANPFAPRPSRGYAICQTKRGSTYYQVTVGKKYVGSFKTPELALSAREAYIQSINHSTTPEPA